MALHLLFVAQFVISVIHILLPVLLLLVISTLRVYLVNYLWTVEG